MKLEDLEKFADGWNRHDIDTLMSYMTDDCAFYLGSGESASGDKYEGYEAVRKAFERVWKDLHANVTRNHRCKDMDELMREVNKYLRRRDAEKQKKYAERRAA